MKRPARTAIALIWIATLALAFQMGMKKRPEQAEEPVAVPRTGHSTQRVKNLAVPSRRASADKAATGKIDTYMRKRQTKREADRNDTPVNSWPQDLPDAVSDALDNSDPIERMSAFTDALKRLDASSVQAVLAAFEERPGDHTDDQEFSMFLFAWARIDGAAAMGYIEEHMEGWQSYRTAYAAMSGWASTDPADAEAWAREQHEGPDNPYLVGVVNGVAKTDLNRATEITQSLPYGRIRGRAVDVLIEAYFKEGVDTTMNWASNLKEGVLKNGIVSRVAARVARDDPFAAAEWAVTLVEGGERNNAVTSIASTWSRSQPREAANYLVQISDEDLRSKALGKVVERWARSDRAAAGAWLTENKDQPGMDEAIQQYAERLRFKDPVSAMTWAASIKNEASRHTLMERVAEEWMERDPEAARDFLNRTP